MVLIAIDLTYLYALWDTFFLYSATAVLAFGCGLAHGIIGVLLAQHFRKERPKEMPTSSTQTNAMTGDEDQDQPDHSRNASANAPANAPIPGNNLGAQQPIPPPMPFAERAVRIRHTQTIPSDISVGLGDYADRYHNAIRPCGTHAKYVGNSRNKTKWFTPCMNCYPEFYSK